MRASGVSPNLFRVVKNHEQARYILRSAILSGFAPVLAIQNKKGVGHAVVAVGLKEQEIHDPADVHFHQHTVKGLYIHDDRLGPNLRCTYHVPEEKKASLGFEIGLRGNGAIEAWELLYILVPMHPKIRLSFADIEKIASSLMTRILSIHSLVSKTAEKPIPQHPIGFDTRILRAHRYIERLICDSNGVDAGHIERISNKVAPARYLAVIRVSGPFFSEFDVVIDSTGTITNPNFLAVVPIQSAPNGLRLMGRFLAEKVLDCPFVD